LHGGSINVCNSSHIHNGSAQSGQGAFLCVFSACFFA
jgi:hypothetical protein